MTKQDQIIALADEIGGEVRLDYSGRGMFGDTCMGIVCDDLDIARHCAAQNGLPVGKADYMGKSEILYWPQIKAAGQGSVVPTVEASDGKRKMEKVKYIALTDEQRQKLLAETGIVQRWLVKRPGEEWTVTGSLPFDAVCGEWYDTVNEVMAERIVAALNSAPELLADNARLRAACLAALPFVLDGQLMSHQNSPRDPRQVSRESAAVEIRHVTGGAA